MRRIASHYVYYQQLYRLSYVELTDDCRFIGVYPLTEEIAGTEFQDGILVPVACNNKQLLLDGFSILSGSVSCFSGKKALLEIVKKPFLCEGIELGVPVRLFLLNTTTLATTELCTDHGCGNSYVERL